MKSPFISLVVVNYNGEDIIKKCLDSLLKVNYPKNKYEIIVVDNASVDKSTSIIKSFKNIKLIKNSHNEGYVGVNSCLNRVKGKHIFVLNNDIEIEKNCVKNLVEIIEKDNSIGIVAPKFINYFNRKIESSGTWVSRSFYTGHYADKTETQKVKDIPYLGIEMVRTDLVKKFGYIYDPDYFIYAEDLDLSLRFRLIGKKTVFVSDAILYHMHAITTKKSTRSFTTFLMERNLLVTFFKIFSFKNILLMLPYIIGMRILAMVKDLVTLNPGNFFARLKAFLWIVFNFYAVYKKRKKTQKLRKVNDKFILKVFSEKYLFKKKILI